MSNQLACDSNAIRKSIEVLYKQESRKIYATLIRLLGDFELAEEALQDAFNVALKHWPTQGMPENPVPWLISTGRFKAIDAIRKQQRQREKLEVAATEVEGVSDIAGQAQEQSANAIEDDQLRLIFTCCHPAIDPKVQVALTLREVCGLTTEEIASAFLVSNTTMAQRIVRGKAKIRDARIPFELPDDTDFNNRLDAVLTVIYLVFNEGYSATQGELAIRSELTSEAIRLTRLLYSLTPDPEVAGLLALMLLNDARKAARTNACGDIILLEDQDRNLWSKGMIAEGTQLVAEIMRAGEYGFYTIQAAISATHAVATTAAATDWSQIIELYAQLHQVSPSPVIELNQAVAIAMKDGPDAGIAIIERLFEHKEMQRYHLAHAAYGELLSRAGRTASAINAFKTALNLTTQLPEQRVLKQKLLKLGEN
ncbi:RNA polymerase sigma factor [Pseudoalteromonas piscicida]|uniref:RNA polymerase sigma factor n=1 Tax=Pseudoalteromonas piscicida TaxID=43662 RepID=UPI001C951235|nr:RNA polymerase sigma factor [Pseudoalteromonas piscicida]QZO11344.1 RNA polymerase sigma factor [Pseudoalteromonas piscicida]